MYAFDNSPRPYLCFGDPADAGRALIVHVLNSSVTSGFTTFLKTTYPGLDAPQAAKFFISCLLPFRYEARFEMIRQTSGNRSQKDILGVGVTLFQQPVIKFPRNGFTLVVKLIYIARTGMRDAHNWPKGFSLAFTLMGFVLRIPHLLCVVVKNLIR